MEKKTKMYFLELIKIIAILMVLYNHRATYNNAPMWNDFSFKCIILQLFATICRCGVPLFLMCSGVVLLGKDESYSRILKHRALKIIVVMILCTFVVAYGDYSITNLVTTFFTRLNWYLYAYLDYLLMLPLLRGIAKTLERKHFEVYMILVSLFTVAGTFVYNADWNVGFLTFAPLFNAQFGSASICWVVIYPLTGYLLVKYYAEEKKFIRYVLPALAVISLTISVIMVVFDYQNDMGDRIDQVRQFTTFAPTICLFCLIKFLYEKIKVLNNDKSNKIISLISGTTFGMFVIETHFDKQNEVSKFILGLPLFSGLGTYEAALIAIVVQFVLLFAIVSILKLIPVVKKIL